MTKKASISTHTRKKYSLAKQPVQGPYTPEDLHVVVLLYETVHPLSFSYQ